jgi:hypothetical protein
MGKLEITYMGIDQYGQTYHGLKHPRKELMETLGNSHVDKMYRDKDNGSYVHVGYIIGGLWITLYEVTPFERKG